MNKRGRPRKNGSKPPWTIRRDTIVLYSYQHAREAGEKHCVAIEEAVAYLRKTEPDMPISNTEVRRILARLRSSRTRRSYFVVKPDATNTITLTLPWGQVISPGLTACMRPRIDYPRANAASAPPQK